MTPPSEIYTLYQLAEKISRQLHEIQTTLHVIGAILTISAFAAACVYLVSRTRRHP